jgi:catechol 2,3-dioxygenase-like lactoylglutathione lyase family enzyme
MAVELNHTIVPARDKRVSAEFLAGVLGVATSPPTGFFLPVTVANGVTLDFMDVTEVAEHHYAFLVTEPEFDAIFERIRATGTGFYADPGRHVRGEINHRYGGRGVYFDDPDGHLMEVLTQPAGEAP